MIKGLSQNTKNVIYVMVFTTALLLVCAMLVRLVSWHMDNLRISRLEKQLQDTTEIVETKDTEKTEIVSTVATKEIEESNPYWDYIKVPLISVDFKNLKATNTDAVGWIQVEGTNINYPFVQTEDNEFYLTHAFDKSKNEAGWVFLDYRNNINTLDDNTILYAHGRYDGAMFGSLKNIFESNWYENESNHIVKMSTESENTLWQVFSVYIIPKTDDYLITNFQIANSYQEFLDKLIKRSDYKFSTTALEDDKILTLSTCYNEEDMVVLHAKLIKREARFELN